MSTVGNLRTLREKKVPRQSRRDTPHSRDDSVQRPRGASQHTHFTSRSPLMFGNSSNLKLQSNAFFGNRNILEVFTHTFWSLFIRYQYVHWLSVSAHPRHLYIPYHTH